MGGNVMSFPTTKDVFVNPSVTSPTNNPSHAGLHTDENTAISAIETKVGINSSTDATSIDYLLKNTSSSNPGHKHTLANGATDITASVTELNYTDGVTSAIQTQIDTKAPTASPTFTGTVTMPVALSGIAKLATGVVSVVTAPSGTIVGTTDAQTLTNKRPQKRVDSQTTTNTITPEISTYDVFVRTAQAHALVINNHSASTPVEAEMMLFELTCDGTNRALTYGDKYLAKAGTALPTTLTANKTTTMLFKWSAGLVGWNLLAVGQEA
jgi:hypothetical protein